MAVVYKPALWRTGAGAIGTTVNGGQLLMLPQPSSSFSWPITWKGETTTGPYQSGATGVYGQARATVPISINGEFGKQGTSATIDEADMWTACYNLQSFLDPPTPTTTFEVFLYYDVGTSTYVKFKKVRPLSFSTDQGDANWVIFPYQITMEALDASIYTTEPGA